ncbi:hypothetical protein FA15DRAFT_756233 [Coprinopsis marcescibilis]|uniref:Mid2 domain-containing protein n=1 Tax=Coprinopsis marcescibilis TaxID=230819 RepID=A0A5C3KXV2_COPMA|nr:hypothetical protein FA15DRAFT_756233 [Coprinopsis marcescibilis]
MSAMVRLALRVFFIITTQVVLSFANPNFNFTSARQCEAFDFEISTRIDIGIQRTATLHVIPFDSVPFGVPLRITSNEGGEFSMTLPGLRANANFVTLLEDDEGNSIGRVSDIARILPSNDESCFVVGGTPVRRYSLIETPSQCEEFAVGYNITFVSQAPQIKVFNPRGFAFFLNQTSDDPSTGTARYMMNVSRGKEVVLLIDDGNGNRQTTTLLTVGGDSLNSRDCFERQREVEAQMDRNNSPNQENPISSRAVIIGSAAGGGAVLLIAIVMCLFIVHERKRRRLRRSITQFDGVRMTRSSVEKPPLPPPAAYGPTAKGTFDPAYTSEKFQSAESQQKKRTDSLASWAQTVPDELISPNSRHQRHQSSAVSLTQSECRSVAPFQLGEERDPRSLSTMDIEGMLNMAAQQSEAARKGSVGTLLSSDLHSTSGSPPREPIAKDSPVLVRTMSTPRRNLKVNSDIPDDLRSAYSRDSVNPFTQGRDIDSPAQHRSPSRDLQSWANSPPSSMSQSPQGRLPSRHLPSWSSSPPGSISQSPPLRIGLPSSPTDVHRLPGRESIARSPSIGSPRSATSWHFVGIAR